MELRDGLAEDAVVPRVHVADAVGADERGTVAVDGLQDTVLEQRPLVRLLAEAGGEDDEGAHVLLGRQRLHRVGAQRGGDGQDGQVGIGNILHVGIGTRFFKMAPPGLWTLLDAPTTTMLAGCSSSDVIIFQLVFVRLDANIPYFSRKNNRRRRKTVIL